MEPIALLILLSSVPNSSQMKTLVKHVPLDTTRMDPIYVKSILPPSAQLKVKPKTNVPHVTQDTSETPMELVILSPM
jgi:hypothetical protein